MDEEWLVIQKRKVIITRNLFHRSSLMDDATSFKKAKAHIFLIVQDGNMKIDGGIDSTLINIIALKESS